MPVEDLIGGSRTISSQKERWFIHRQLSPLTLRWFGRLQQPPRLLLGDQGVLISPLSADAAVGDKEKVCNLFIPQLASEGGSWATAGSHWKSIVEFLIRDIRISPNPSYPLVDLR